MFFLLRSAFWLGLVFLFLPAEGDPKADTGARIVQEASAAAAAGARRATGDAARLCLEQTRACLEAAALLSGSDASVDTLTGADRVIGWGKPRS